MPNDLCGTDGFISPEMRFGQAYDEATDWYSFGATIFTIVTGKSLELKDSHLHYKNKTQRKREFTEVEKDQGFDDFVPVPQKLPRLVESLLNTNPRKRSYLHLKQQPFFNGIDWDAVEKRQNSPPLVGLLTDKRRRIKKRRLEGLVTL